METITYLVANYNNARYLEDCLLSLKNQTCDRWRCIVCDDHSSDHSVAIIKRHLDFRIRLLENSSNVGYVGALKRMIAAAPSDVVAILDSDDALEKDATASMLQTYADDKSVGFVFARYTYMDESLRHRMGVSGAPGDGRGGRWELLMANGNVCGLRSFRKSLYYRTQGLDENMRYAEDRDLAYKLEEATRPVFIDKALYKYRQVPHSQSNDPAKIKIARRNHFRAKKDALRRRRVRGPGYLPLLAYLRLDVHFLASPAGAPWPKRLCKIMPRLAHKGLAKIIAPSTLGRVRPGRGNG